MDFYHDEHYRLIRKHTIAEDCHGRKASIQYKLVGTLFRVLRVNKMLDKEGPEFEKLLETYRIKQKKPLAVPYKRMDDFDIITKTVEGTTVFVVRKKGAMPQKAVLYLFGGGYILPPDPGDIVLGGQIAKETDAQVWFPIYPMAPEHTLAETVRNTLQVYREILKSYSSKNVRFFGTSSGGGLAMSVCVYIPFLTESHLCWQQALMLIFSVRSLLISPASHPSISFMAPERS